MINNDKIIKESINKISNFYKNPVLDEDNGNDMMSDISNTSRKMNLCRIVDCLSIYESACEQEHIIADDNKQKIE